MYFGVTEGISQIGLETTIISQCRGGTVKIIAKCTECGNTFKKEEGIDLGEVITCPICEAQYKVLGTISGKLCLQDFVYDENDPGEL